MRQGRATQKKIHSKRVGEKWEVLACQSFKRRKLKSLSPYIWTKELPAAKTTADTKGRGSDDIRAGFTTKLVLSETWTEEIQRLYFTMMRLDTEPRAERGKPDNMNRDFAIFSYYKVSVWSNKRQRLDLMFISLCIEMKKMCYDLVTYKRYFQYRFSCFQ